jgi:tetratricopeptide (TPR) repeat protein
MKAFQDALALDPQYRDAAVGEAYSLYALERYDEARPLLARLVREGEGGGFQSPLADVDEVRARYAWTLFYLDDYAGARAQFAKALAAHPDWAGLHNGLGWASLRLGDRARAAESFRRALGLRADLQDAQEGLALTMRSVAR